jgi:Na+/pantothenate symporter
MRKSTLIGIIALVLVASFASAASFIKPTGTVEDFCFGYAICE